MKNVVILGMAVVAGVALLVFIAFRTDADRPFAPAAIHLTQARAAEAPQATTTSTTGLHEGLLYGRVETDDGAVHEGRLRFGGDQEALWANYFNGLKPDNAWLEYVEGMPDERASIEIFGIELPWRRPTPFSRPFMARFGDIDRIEPRGRDLFVTLRSGTVVHLDRYAADDLADGVRVWDADGGIVDIGEWPIRAIEFLPTPNSGAGPLPLFGSVHTPERTFTGFIQWNRQQCLVSDELHGAAGQADLGLRFEAIRSMARRADGQFTVRLTDGRDVVLSNDAGEGGTRGVFVDDARYGRVLVSPDAIERVEFSDGGTGPAYEDFAPGRPLTGRVITRSGRRLTGRIVYDLDESETTDTLDASSGGVDYAIPFGAIAAIDVSGAGGATTSRARILLRNGEALALDRTGDLAESNAGLLVFTRDGQRPEFVRWSDVDRVELAA